MTVFALKRFLHVAQLCGYCQVSRWLWPYNGWLHLPYETRGVLPRFWFVVGDGMFGSRSLAFFASSLSLLAPLQGGFWFLWPLDLWSQLTVKRMTITFMKAHYELTWEDSERDFVVVLLSCTAWLMLGLTSEQSLHVCLGSCDTYFIFVCMLLIEMQWIFHCFQLQIDSVGVFVLGSGPVFVFWCFFCFLLRCFRWRNASLAGGFAGRRFFVWLWFLCFGSIDLLISRTLCPCTEF